jgi:hypothetical protein
LVFQSQGDDDDDDDDNDDNDDDGSKGSSSGLFTELVYLKTEAYMKVTMVTHSFLLTGGFRLL